MSDLSANDLVETANLEILERECYCQTDEPDTFDLCTTCLVRHMRDLIEQQQARIEEMERALQKIAQWDVEFPEYEDGYAVNALMTAREVAAQPEGE